MRSRWRFAVLLVAATAIAAPALGQEASTTSVGPDEATTTAPTTTTTTPAQSVKGRLREGDRPIEGVNIVITQDGKRIGEDTTGRDGAWEIGVPAPGQYEVSLDVGTLPDGVKLRQEDGDTRTVTVRATQRRNVLFPLGEGRRATAERDTALEQMIKLGAIGVKVGLLVALAAVGLSLIYGVANLVNFAHGELVTFGALMAFLFNASGTGPGIHLAIAGVIAVLAGGALGLFLETSMFGPLRRRRTEGVSLIVFTIGLSLLVRHAFLVMMGGRSRPYTDYTLQRAYDLGPISLPPKDYVISLIAIAALVAVALLLQRTKIGTGMRAVSDNRMLAESSGINVQHVIRFTWLLAGALAALGGVLLGVTEQVSWDMGFELLLFMFAAVVVGGLGTAYGAMAGGLLVGVISQTSTYWINIEYKDAVALGVLIVALIVRPQGILGRRERVG